MNGFSKGDERIYINGDVHDFLRALGGEEYQDYILNSRLNFRSYQGIAIWTHTLNAKAFFNLKLHYLTRRFRFADMLTHISRIEHDILTNPVVDSLAFDAEPIIQENRLWQAKFDMAWQANDRHLLQAGAEFAFRRIWSNRSFALKDRHVFKPTEVAVYLQNRIEHKNFTMNAGIRLDYFDPKVLGTDPNNLFEIVDENIVARELPVHAKLRLSPRLSLAREFGQRTKLYLSYGHFYQIPEYINNHFYFQQQTFDIINGILKFDPFKTIEYEIGWEQQMIDFLGWSIVGFYSDRNLDNDIVRAEFSKTRGVEINLRTRRYKHFASYFSYTFSRSEIKNSLTRVHISGFNAFKHKANWELPHIFNCNLDFRYSKNEGPRLGHAHVLENLGVNLMVRSQSGFPYTPIFFTETADTSYFTKGSENTARRPFTWQLDLRVEKLFETGKIKWSLFTEILNLTNRRNVIEVSHFKGVSRDPLVTDFERPYHIGPQRNIRLGLQVER